MTYHTPLSFGRHRGTPLDRVPLPYLLWLSSRPNLDPRVRSALLDAIYTVLTRQRELLAQLGAIDQEPAA